MHLTGHATGSLWLDEILVGALQFVEGRPLLPVPIHKLAFILANRTIVRRFNTWRVLRAAGRAKWRTSRIRWSFYLGHYYDRSRSSHLFYSKRRPPSRCFDNNL